MQCPQCNLNITFDNRVFRGDFVCEQCGVKLRLSETYARTVVVMSILLGFGLEWFSPMPKWLMTTFGPLVGFTAACALGFPISSGVLVLLVRLVPRIVSPSLVLRDNGPFTLLKLSSEEERQNSSSRPENS